MRRLTLSRKSCDLLKSRPPADLLETDNQLRALLWSWIHEQLSVAGAGSADSVGRTERSIRGRGGRIAGANPRRYPLPDSYLNSSTEFKPKNVMVSERALESENKKI